MRLFGRSIPELADVQLQQAPATGRAAITASGRRIPLSDRNVKARPRQQWQTDAWAYRDSIGEIRYAMAFLRHAASRMRLLAGVANPDGEKPTPVDEAEGIPAGVASAARDALARLTAGTYNYAPLLAPYAENLEVPGECMLVGYTDDQGEEQWVIRSVDEVRKTDRGWRLLEDENDKDGRPLDENTSYLARLWQPHPRWFARADSPMRALLDPCEELQLVGRAVRGASRSRLATAGILGVANELDFVSSPGPEQDPDDPDADPFFEKLIEAAVANLTNEGEASAVVPIMLRGSAEALEKGLKHLTLERPLDPTLLERQEKALGRIGMGLDVPPEIITGMAAANHWSAWAIDDSTFRHHLEPLVQRMVDGLTVGYFRSVLAEYGVPTEWVRRLVIGYDATDLVTRPNRGEDAKTGHEAGVLSDVALVEALGFDPATDMPDAEELARRAEWRRSQRSGQAPVSSGPAAEDEPGGDAGGGDDGEEIPGPSTGIRAAATPEPAGRVLRAYPRQSRRLTDLDRGLRDRLTAAADAAVRRALERAGNRARSAANRDPDARNVVASVPPRRAVAALGDALVADLGLDDEQLLAGAWTDLRDQWDAWIVDAGDDALATAVDLVGGDPDAADTAQARAALAANADEAWEYLVGELDAATSRLLRDPDDTGRPDPLGETDRSLVDTSVVRAALAIVGGIPVEAAGVTTGGLPAAPGERVGGLAAGGVIDQFLRGRGTDIVAYEWVYGISTRHFPPHRNLDGVTFAQYGDPVLENPRPDGWPAATLAPGDHRGCHCDAAPIYADGLNTAAALDAAGDATYDPSYLNVLRQIAADDLAAGRTDTDAVRTVAEADRIAAARPSKE